jgi:hypothetical protein
MENYMRYILAMVDVDYGKRVIMLDDGTVQHTAGDITPEVASTFWNKHKASIKEDTKNIYNMPKKYSMINETLISIRCYTDKAMRAVEFTKAQLAKSLKELPATTHTITVTRVTYATTTVDVTAHSIEEATALVLSNPNADEYKYTDSDIEYKV